MTALDWILTAAWVVFGLAGTAVIVREYRRSVRESTRPDYARIRQLEEELGLRPPRVTTADGREYYRLQNGRLIRPDHYDEYVAMWGDDPVLEHSDERRYEQAMREKWGDEIADLDAIRDYPAGGER